jgi:hypothetical protein
MAYASGLLHVDSSEEGKVLRQRWSGRVNELRPSAPLDAYFNPVIDKAKADGLTMEHHFEKLEYFNSAFISWVIHHLKRTIGQQIKTVIYYDSKSNMHRSSFDALKILQRDNPWLEVLEAQVAP